MDVGEVLLGRDPAVVASARNRAQHTWPAIVGFAAGAAIGAACFAAAGRWLLALLLKGLSGAPMVGAGSSWRARRGPRGPRAHGARADRPGGRAGARPARGGV
jgi:hypothetical protein